MMRAGLLKHAIVIERAVSTLNEAGTPIDTWSPLATVRAQLAESSTSETTGKAGSTFETTALFKIRFRDDITAADRIAFQGDTYTIAEIKDFGRRGGLELRATRDA